MPARGAVNPVFVVAVVAIAALAAVQVARTATAEARGTRPALAEMLWPGHPLVMTDNALLAIGKAAAKGQAVPPATRAAVLRIAAKAPLSPTPFLVEGAIAETEGRNQAAERLLIEARRRDPRSGGARYLLAERYFRTGRITAGLIEMQVLVALQSRGTEVFGPIVVAYARQPGAIPHLRGFFRKYPRAEASVLYVLATDAANADLVLALASNDRNPEPDWRAVLVSALASAGEYSRAHALWARLSRVRADQGLFNPAFADLNAPPPFNWAFPQTSEGVAEPDGRGGLEVLYYGRANAVLAAQLLVLPPGRYRLAMSIAGVSGEEGAAHWVVRCAKGDTTLADLPLRAGGNAAAFEVPDGCGAQWLELQGRAGELPRTSELTIRALGLSREVGR